MFGFNRQSIVSRRRIGFKFKGLHAINVVEFINSAEFPSHDST